MKKAPAALLGLLAASVLPAVCFAILYPLSGQRDLHSVAGTFVVSYFFTAAATLILGAPAFLLLNRLNLVRWWSAAGFGALAGVAMLLTTTSSLQVELVPAIGLATLGAMAGLVFWMFWRVGRA
jgi:hypothetical protein